MDFQIIHIVLGKANTERMNGVNRVVNSLATYQTKLGYETKVWGITKNPIINFPSRLYKTELFLDKFKFILSRKIKKKIKNLHGKKVVFHIHGGFIPQFFSIAKQLTKYNLKYVYTVHGAYNSIALERSALKKKIYTFLFENYLVKNAKHLHFLGNIEVSGAKKIFKHFLSTIFINRRAY